MAVNLFDANFYRSVNPDLAGFNDAQAFQHLINAGLNEGRTFSQYVDLNVYRANNPDLAAAGLTTNRQLYDHLSTNGAAEGRTFSSVFNANVYRALNADLQAAGLSNEQLFDHFRAFGINEGRQASESFSASYYLAANPDLQAAGFNNQQALQHYVFLGAAEGRAAAPGGAVAPVTQAPPPVAEPGSTPETAADLGIFTGTRSFDNFVGSADLNDYYRFTLDQVHDLNLTLGGMSDNANVALYLAEEKVNGSFDLGDQITSSGNYSDSDESISRSLGAGTYYVRVYPYEGWSSVSDTRYTLKLTATPTGIGDIANNTFNMGVLNGTQTFTDFVGSTDSHDYYLFTLDRVQDLNLTLGGMTDNANVSLYLAEEKVDGQFALGDQITSSGNYSDSEESISRSLGAGAYYVLVYPYEGWSSVSDTKYTLRLSTDSGTSTTSSNSIDILTNSSTVNELPASADFDNVAFNDADVSVIQEFGGNGAVELGNVASNQLLNTTQDLIGDSLGIGADFDSGFTSNVLDNANFNSTLSLL
jgi:hypothetical protein